MWRTRQSVTECVTKLVSLCVCVCEQISQGQLEPSSPHPRDPKGHSTGECHGKPVKFWILSSSPRESHLIVLESRALSIGP